MNEVKQYSWIVSGNAPKKYPAETFFGLLFCGNGEEDIVEIPPLYPFAGNWGTPLSCHIHNRDTFAMPHRIEIVWLSLLEKKFFSLEKDLSRDLLEQIWTKGNTYEYIIVGMAPNGFVSLWFWSTLKSINIAWYKAEPVKIPMEMFLPNHPELTIEQYCEKYLENLGLPITPISIQNFNNLMKEYAYRYIVQFEKLRSKELICEKYASDNIVSEIEYIEESLYNGTHDKLHDGGLQKYHQAGKPKKLAIKWHIGKSEYSAYFWFEEEPIREVFDKFYGTHLDTKTDFIIRMDAENKKYELALYRYGLKEPQIISEDVYQLLVFKNQFEDYRSDNYNQEPGAWMW